MLYLRPPSDLVKEVDGVLASIGLDYRCRYEASINETVDPEINIYRRGRDAALVGIQLTGALYAVNEYEYDDAGELLAMVDRGLYGDLREAAIGAAQALIDGAA